MGSEIRPFKESGEHSYHRRAFNHNYHAPFIYHIIIKKSSDCEIFGSIAGNASIAPGLQGCAYINESALGKIIAKSILHIQYEFPILKVLQFCVMPDHLHLLLQVLFKSDKHLDFYIDTLKENIAAKYSILRNRGESGSVIGKTEECGSVNNKIRICVEEIFEPGYCDKPLYDNRSLEGLYQYIRHNPHRLAMRKQYPQFFQRVRKLHIGEKDYEAYGNLFLFRNPDKEAVKISRSFTSEEKSEKIDRWLQAASQGTILISPFIGREEKQIRAEAEKRGANIILITHEAFSERYKPAAHDFNLCTQGRLLIISLGLPAATPLSRQYCLQMNDIATLIAEKN